MPKGSAKFGGKSGVLPEARQIFKNPIKPVVRPANPNVGYAEGVAHPRGISREQPEAEVRTVQELIKSTIKHPGQVPDLATLNEQQKEKVTKAALRRQYYSDSLHKEEKKLSLNEKRRHEREEKEKTLKEESKYEMSESTKLTLPTINKLLEGPMMRQRTVEEQQILDAKRQANRLQNVLRGKENRATDLLELYYAAEHFITTEEDLKAAIKDAFDSERVEAYESNTLSNRSHNAKLLDALFGTINSHPGVVAVEEQITGERAEFEQRVAEASEKVLAEKKEQALSEAARAD